MEESTDPLAWYRRKFTPAETRSEAMKIFERSSKEDGCIGGHRQEGVRVNVFTVQRGRHRTMWCFQDAEGARRCVATGLIIPNVSLVDREDREFPSTEEERLRCFQHTAA